MQNIILIGFMACGKSTLGKKLANKMNFEFIDTDQEIENNEHCSITEIFEKFGENHFRELEKKLLLSLQDKQNCVISTGGGLPCFNENMTLLNQIGTSFYIKLNPIELSKRILNAKTIRPLAKGKSQDEVYTFVKELLSKREDFYAQAKFTLSGKEQNIKFIESKLF